MILFRWDLKTSCIKNGEYIHILSKNEKNDSHFNFCNFSLLVPKANKFVVVCICIIIFHGIYSPLPQNTFFVGAKHFFLYLVARAWEYFKFLGDLLYWGVLISFFGVGG